MVSSTIVGMCADGIPKSFGLFDFSIAPQLLFYSYVPVLVLSILFSFFILRRGESNLPNRILSAVGFFFSFWILNIFLQWVAVPNKLVFLSWQLTAVFEIPIFLLSYYLVRVFARESNIPRWEKIALSIVYGVVVMGTPSMLNISGYDYTQCQGVLGGGWYIIYGIELVSIVAIAIAGIFHYKKLKNNTLQQKKNALFTLATILFLGVFFLSNVIGEFSQEYQINFIGPIGMVAFLAITTYLIVKYRSFNAKLFGAQALIYSLWALVASLVFINNLKIIHTILFVTIVFVVAIGLLLIRAVKREISQRQRLQDLTQNLAEANEKLKSLDKLKTEFISLASHQLRSPLTAIKGYASMLYEGSFGAMSDKQVEGAKRIYTSAQGLTNIVEDLLNVTKIEQGGMKYEFIATDLGKLVTDLYAEMKIPAESKHLEFTLDLPTDEVFMISADPVKLKQVFLNLVDNSIKYTQNGYVKLALKRDRTNIVFTVTDSGMGITPETRAKLFEKFSRGDDKTNTGGSGLGLYLAREIARAHKGDVVIESEGLGKGSTFVVTLPATGLPR